MLILIRHGETTANAAGLLVGRLDVELTERGWAQVEALRPHVGSASALVSSPLRRALDTAGGLGLRVVTQIDERWTELDYGAYDGVPLASVPEPTWQCWRAEATFRPEGGETLAELGARVREACEELFGVTRPEASSPRLFDSYSAARDADVIVVTHTSPIKAAVAWAIGSDDTAAWRMRLSTGSITRIDWADGAPLLRCFNLVP